jgi:hypothetical protein
MCGVKIAPVHEPGASGNGPPETVLPDGQKLQAERLTYRVARMIRGVAFASSPGFRNAIAAKLTRFDLSADTA